MLKRLLIAVLLCGAVCADAGNRLQTHNYRAPWTPYSVLENSATLAAWWSAEDYSRMVDDGSGLISSWTGRKGLAITAATSARPTWARNSFNSAYPGVTFDGVANTLATTTLTSLPTGATAGEIWAIANISTSAVAGRLVQYGGTGTNTRQLLKSTTNIARISDGTVDLTSATSALGNLILGGSWASTTQNGFVDGGAFAGNPSTISTINTSTTRLRIGASSAGTATAFLACTVADVIIISGTLSTADRQRMEGYLAWKYALASLLPTTHPYRWAPP